MSVPPTAGLRTFAAIFEAPLETRHLGQDIWFEGLVAGEGITVGEIARLVAVGHLRLGYAFYSGPSTSPAAHSGQATLHLSNEGELRYRLVLQPSAFIRQLSGLLHLGFFYEGLGSFEEWGVPGTWAVISLSEADPFQSYFARFNTSRA